MMTINVDDQIKIAKKLSVEEKLSDLRKLLGEKIPKKAIFILNDGTEINIDDEVEFKISDITDNKKILMKIAKDQNEIPVEVYINQKLKYKKNLSKKTELNKIRELLSDIMIKETYFMTEEGAQIDKSDEGELSLENVLNGNKLNIYSFNNTPKEIKIVDESDDTSSGEENIKEEKILMEFYLDDKLSFNKKILNTTKLCDVRKLISSKITDYFHFISKEDTIITSEEENNLKINKIIKDKNKVYLKLDKKTNNTNNKNIIEIYLNKQLISNKKLKISDNLPTIRKILKDKINEDFQFVFPNGLKIDIEEEEDFSLEEIIVNNTLNLYNKENEEKKDITIKNEQPAKTPELSRNIPDNSQNIPIEGSILINEEGGLKIYNYPTYEFTPQEQQSSKKIMIIGPTGTGKTTLLNSYINYLMKIKYTDNFRYKIINENFVQSYSQTKNITNYNIKTPEGKFYQIIDTPGFGDTAGIEEDERITKKITDFLLHEINEINAVCLVVKSSDNRLTACQKYIFNCVFDLFGEDTKDIFIAMLTFCDGGKPPALASLTDKSCLFSEIIKHRSNDWYFKFNNSAIFEKDEEDVLNLTYWNIGMDSFAKFTQKLDTLPTIGLSQTKTVLNERSRLTENVEILSKKLKDALNQTETIKGYFKIISDLKGDLNDSKNFKKKIKVPKTKKKPITEKGKYMTTCLICNKTCHSGCYIKDDDDKSGCACIKNDYCTVCKNRCHWSEHKNRPYELIDYMDEEIVTLEDLKSKYYDSKKQFDVKTQLLMGAKNDLVKLNLECITTQQEMMKSINRLKEIALNKTIFGSVEEHIDEMILNEKSEHKDGWQTRVQCLQVMKEQKKKLREISEGNNEDFDIIKKVIEDSISNENNLKSFIEEMNGKDNNCLIF